MSESKNVVVTKLDRQLRSQLGHGMGDACLDRAHERLAEAGVHIALGSRYERLLEPALLREYCEKLGDWPPMLIPESEDHRGADGGLSPCWWRAQESEVHVRCEVSTQYLRQVLNMLLQHLDNLLTLQ
mgnify:CR=1 FL=1